MKSLGSFVSITNKSNRVIGSADSDWSGLRSGDFIRFGNDNILYTINNVNSYIFFSEFEVQSNFSIKLKNPDIANISKWDIITLFYQEYELLTVFGIKNAGLGYKVGDIVFVRGGYPSKDNRLNQVFYTSFKITKVGPNGEVLYLVINEKGKYLSQPESIVELDGGNGNNLKIEVDYVPIKTRLSIEREVSQVHEDGRIYFNSPLMIGMQSGNISINKWEMYLTNEYLGQTVFGSTYTIIRDFTEYYKLPLGINNLQSLVLAYNQSMNFIDAKLKELESKITSS